MLYGGSRFWVQRFKGSEVMRSPSSPFGLPASLFGLPASLFELGASPFGLRPHKTKGQDAGQAWFCDIEFWRCTCILVSSREKKKNR
jgi:hypothetical protein